MNENKKMKVVWICSVSNPMLRSHLNLYMPLWHRVLRSLRNRKVEDDLADFAQWNTNAINEFNNIDSVDLHVVFAHPMMRKNVQKFKDGNISFYAVNEGDGSIVNFLKQHLAKKNTVYKNTWKSIVSLVKEIQPQIIHIMGAENPSYSLSILSLPKDIPVIVHLQTILHEPQVTQHYPNLNAQKQCEKAVIMRANYLGTKSSKIPNLVREYIKQDTLFVNTGLMLSENINLKLNKKEFDFVYFAKNINKSIDLAIEAFGIAHRKYPELTLDVIGEVSENEKVFLNKRLEELDLKNSVKIEGKLPTHEDVIEQIKKARVALLPLKIDFVSGTIREAISNGLPVVTTITSGTPGLNEERESVLLSEIGDHDKMASNMIQIITDSNLAERLRRNGVKTIEKRYGTNAARAEEWVAIYGACINNFYSSTPIPDKYLNKN